MSWFERTARNTLIALALCAPVALSACTLTPVYGDRASAEATYRLAYAEPKSRLDQIVYQELGLRFGSGAGPDVPLLTVSVSASGRVLARSVTTDPAKAYESTATARITLMRGGEVLFEGTRQASSTYTYRGQAFTDRAAEAAASEQAAKAVAEVIRLTVIAALADAR